MKTLAADDRAHSKCRKLRVCQGPCGHRVKYRKRVVLTNGWNDKEDRPALVCRRCYREMPEI